MKKITRILLLSLGLIMPFFLHAVEPDKPLSVAERNALQGFNDTIDRLAEDFIEASILFENQGYYLFSTLGHIALRLKCATFGKDYVYSYEGEHVDYRFWQSVTGKLKMKVYSIPTAEYIAQSEAQKLGLIEYALNLTPQQEQKLWEVVDSKKKKRVKYDLFYHGCAGSVREWVTEALGKTTICYQTPMSTHGLYVSDIFLKYTEPDWAQFAIATMGGGNLVYGNGLTDIERLVAPRDLVYEWQRATINGRSLLSKEGHSLAHYVPVKKSVLSPMVSAILMAILALVSWFLKKDYIDWWVFGIYTLLTICIYCAAIIPSLSVTGWTWLMIAYNPLPIVAWKWRRYWSIPFVVILSGWILFLFIYAHRVTTYAHMIFIVAFMLTLLKPYIKNTFSKIVTLKR